MHHSPRMQGIGIVADFGPQICAPPGGGNHGSEGVQRFVWEASVAVDSPKGRLSLGFGL